MKRYYFKEAFFLSLPVLAGYLALGTAFGVLFGKAGYPFWLAGIMSLTVYGGSMQFAAVMMLSSHMPIMEIIVLSILINIRHIVYGLSLFEKFQSLKWLKPYLIFTLTDETYALLCTIKIPQGADPGKFMALLAGLNHLYWISGGMLGTLAGTYLEFNSKGIEFTMTAIFIVILTELCRVPENRLYALLGGCITLSCRLLFGVNAMMIPAIATIIIILLIMRYCRKKRVETLSQ